jgi:hypothetical protein
MLQIRKWRRLLYSWCLLAWLSEIAPVVFGADETIPTGFKPDRYQGVWERNPFTLVTPAAQEVRTTPFDKLILVSWLNDGGKDIAFVQNTDTSEVQKVTNDPNANNLRLVEIHKNADPQKADVVLSNGAEQGSVKFRLELPAGVPQVEGAPQQPGVATGAQGKVPVPGMPAAPAPGLTRQMQLQQNAQQALQQAARIGAAQMQPGAAQMQPGAAQMQPESGTMPPRAAEVRRKRITPPPAVEQPVGVPAPYQNPENQVQPQ